MKRFPSHLRTFFFGSEDISLRFMEQNYFQGLEIYFKGTKIYFQAFEIYFRATEKVYVHGEEEKHLWEEEIVSVEYRN